MFNFNHLYYFYVTAKLGGVTAAAKQLNTSQPSLSAQIKSLESAMNKSLFRKSGRNIELTNEGHEVYTYCAQMFEVADQLEAYTKGRDSLKRMKVSIGVSHEIEKPFIANVIGSTMKKSTDKNRPVISMLSQPDEEDLRRALKFNKIDFLISDSPVYDGDLEVKATFTMPVVFFIAPELAEELKIKVKDPVSEAMKKAVNHLALPTGYMRLRQETDLFLQKKKLKINLVFETDILSSIVRSVVDGIAAGILPLPYILKEMRQGLIKVVAPSEGLWQHKIYVITNKNLKKNAFLDQLLAVLDSENKALGRFNL